MEGRTNPSTRQMAAMDPNDLMHFVHHHPTLDAILSTLYSTTADGLLKPAHGHSQPLFGPPDPWLSTGDSIPPNLKALGIDPAPITSDLPQAKEAIEKGLKVVDASTFQAGGGNALPGFTPTRHILPQAGPVPDITMETFTNQVFGSAKFLRAFENFPKAALAYVIIDFFFLRPDVDLYKEDIEEEPLDVAAETFAVTGVRLGVFFLITLVTLGLFG